MSEPEHTTELAPDVLDRPLLVFGTLVAVVGVVMLVVPGLRAPFLDRRILIVIIGSGAVVASLLMASKRLSEDAEVAETGDPEIRRPFPTPGAELKEDLEHADRPVQLRGGTRDRITERLYEAAVAVVRRRERVSQSTAERLVDTGEWTDDDTAARFLGDPEELGDDAEGTDRGRFTSILQFQTKFGYEAHETVRTILELAGREFDADEEADPGDVAPGPATHDRDLPVDRETGWWVGASGIVLLMAGLAVVRTSAVLLLTAAVAATYAAFAFRAHPPAVDLEVERSFDLPDDDAEAGSDDRGEGAADDASVDASPEDEVRVTLTVENTGDRLLSDLRLVDGVPAGLEVVDGSPRLGTALRPGDADSFSYDVEAVRGDHEFGPLQVIARDASGANEHETQLPAPGRLACLPQLEDVGTVPLFGAATRYTGRVATETGGEGVEFYSTREYRPGDPPGRIDWNRHARTRELATLLFREEKAATVVLLVDARERAYRAPWPGDRHAVERSVAAAGRLFESLLDGGDRVGLAAFGPRSCWVAPGAGNTHREHVRRTLATDPAFDYQPPDEQFLASQELTKIRRRAPVDAQFVLLSPLTDDYIETVARRLKAHGHPVTVVSPDVTGDGAIAERLMAVERDARLNRLRESAVRVVDWGPDEDLRVALERASAGWSA